MKTDDDGGIGKVGDEGRDDGVDGGCATEEVCVVSERRWILRVWRWVHLHGTQKGPENAGVSLWVSQDEKAQV